MDGLTPERMEFVRETLQLGRFRTVGEALAVAAVKVLETGEERDHWKNSYNQVVTEINVLAAIVMKQLKVTRLVITHGEYEQLEKGLELHTGSPEPGVRVYEMRPKGLSGAPIRDFTAMPFDRAAEK